MKHRRHWRLNALHSVVGRNLVSTDRSNRISIYENLVFPDLYYQLVAEDNTILYTSEVVFGSLNPIWLPIEFTEEEKDKVQYINSFTFRIREASSHVVWLDVAVAMEELEVVESVTDGKIQSSKVTTPVNQVLISLSDDTKLWYAVPYQKCTATKVLEIPVEFDLSKAVAVIERKSKCLNESLSLKSQIQNCKLEIEALLKSQESSRVCQTHIHNLNAENAVLEYQIQTQKVLLRRETLACKLEEDELRSYASVYDCLMKIDHERDYIKEVLRSVALKRSEVLVVAKELRIRQAMLVQELSDIYPIERSLSGEYCIRGIDYDTAKDDELIATALGFICHLVFMLAKYYQVNLRYHLVNFSSRSIVRDLVRGSGGEYPLYKKGIDRERFETAVTLLKLNIQQLLRQRGIVVANDRPKTTPSMLLQLKTLIEEECKSLHEESY